MAPPMPRSAYLSANPDEVAAQAQEHAETALLSGPAALPAAMVGAMLPAARDENPPGPRRTKACVMRVARALEPYQLEIKFVSDAMAWKNPIKVGRGAEVAAQARH